MTSSNCYSSLYPFPIDLNEDDQHQHHQHPLFSFKSQTSASSSLTCPIFYNPAGYYQREHQQYFQDQQEEAKTYVPEDHGPILESTDSGLKLSIRKKEERVEISHKNNSSAKWIMSSKTRTVSSDHADLSTPKFEDQKQMQPSSSPDNSSNSFYINNNKNSSNTIRVCADCNTTKTPLWRSGPRGPKSLCNACGIRQRKARRALAAAAAASANGTIVAAKTTQTVKISKAKRSSPALKNNKKFQSHQGRKKLCFEDLSKNISAFHHGVFPQDEKEAAILLMSLSYGLVHA